MIYDFHTHTFLTDGINSPIELIRCAYVNGYKCIAITDHASYGNIDEIIAKVKKDCRLGSKYWDIIAIAGVELTHIPENSINDMAKYAKEQKAEIVIVHGETIVEPVETGTNKQAVNSKYVDILAHPGFITPEEAEIAAKNDIYIEITRRAGHSLSNGHVARIGTDAGVKFLINSDAHSHSDLYKKGLQEKIALAAGLSKEQAKNIIEENFLKFLKKIGH